MEKKLIYILNHYSNKSVQHFYHVINLLVAMADKGVEIALVIEKCEDNPPVIHKNIKVIFQKERGSFRRVVELFNILVSLYKEGYKKVYIRISMNSAIVSIFSAKIYKAKTYYWHSGTTYQVDKGINSLINKIKWFVLSHSKFLFIKTFVDYFVTGPETMVEYYINELNVKRAKMVLLYNDIDIKRFNVPTLEEKKQIKERLGLDKYEKVVLMVHRLSPVRKTDIYIPSIFESEKFIKAKATLVIIGDGPEKKLLESLIEKSPVKDHIKLLGPKPNNEVQDYYKAADIFVNPSYTEGFPRVVIEAMACGLPVVATNAGGTIDIFGEQQRKYIVERTKIEEFREALIEIIYDNDKLAKLSRENLKRVKRFSTESVSDMYIQEIFK